ATMEEGVIDSWLVEIGEEVEEGDPVAEVQTDKITMEIEAEFSGVLLKTLYEPGDSVSVQHTIAYIGEAGEEVPEENEQPKATPSQEKTTEPSDTGEREQSVTQI